MNGAVDNGYVVFTHDLDFGAILAATQGKGPSVIQVRVRDIFPSSQEGLTVGILGGHEADLEKGSMVVVEASRARVRVLPLTRQEPPASQE